MHRDSLPGSWASEALPGDLSAVKRATRSRVLAARDALPEDAHRQLSVTIAERARLLPEMAAAATLMLFASFGSEVDTRQLIVEALTEGKTVCLPRVLAPRLMAAYQIIDPDEDLATGNWGIREPRDGLKLMSPEAFDAIVVPGAVFDRTGSRYGYGGGFYDSYLPLTRPGVPRIALAFDLQIADLLTTEPHDVAMDVIVSETRVIRRA